jgi:hypothetical protein
LKYLSAEDETWARRQSRRPRRSGATAATCKEKYPM